MNIDKIQQQLKNDMTIDGVVHKRYYHSLEVAKMAVELSKVHHLNIDLEKVYLAGLLHDATKLINKDEQKKMLYCLGYNDDDEIMKSTNVWHGETATLYVKNEYNIDDEEILNAIKFHVYGRVNMTLFEKILVIADFAEDSREYARCKEVRKILDEGNFDLAMYLCIKYTIEAVLAKGDMPLAEQYEILNELNQKI
jgi:predicted HD superfamily hydrolase involved in NAD metabolism